MAERLERLEVRCRWLAAGLVGLVALMIGGGLVAMAVSGRAEDAQKTPTSSLPRGAGEGAGGIALPRPLSQGERFSETGSLSPNPSPKGRGGQRQTPHAALSRGERVRTRSPSPLTPLPRGEGDRGRPLTLPSAVGRGF